MKYRVTWTVDVEADGDAEAREAARRYLLEHEDEALAKVALLEEHVSARDVPEIDAEGEAGR